MSRSLKKPPFIDPKLKKKIDRVKTGALKGPIKTWSRDSVIYPDMVGMVIEVHNGRIHIPVKIIEDMVGHHLGEFAPTRKFVRHGGKVQKELERKTPPVITSDKLGESSK